MALDCVVFACSRWLLAASATVTVLTVPAILNGKLLLSQPLAYVCSCCATVRIFIHALDLITFRQTLAEIQI